MALVRIPEERRTIDDAQSIASFLEAQGIAFERWRSERPIPQDATADVVLQTYADKIEMS